MGDYTKIIVNAELEITEEKLREWIEDLPLTESAYHCEGSVVQITKDSFNKSHLFLVLVGQTKWGRGQQEFLELLAPLVRQGSGEEEIWAIQIHEYGQPNFWKMEKESDL